MMATKDVTTKPWEGEFPLPGKLDDAAREILLRNLRAGRREDAPSPASGGSK